MMIETTGSFKGVGSSGWLLSSNGEIFRNANLILKESSVSLKGSLRNLVILQPFL